MGIARTISRNVFSNFAGYFVNAIVGFLLTPYVLTTLGGPAWGLWSMIVAFTGYYGILDLGVRSGVGHYTTRYWAKGDIGGINKTFATATVINCAIAAVLSLATLVIALLSPHLFDTELPSGEMRTVILIMGLGVAINFPLASFGAATYARQRFDIANTVGILERIATALVYVWVLSSGYGLVGVAAVTVASQTAGNLVRMVIAYRLLPGLKIDRKLFTRESVRELFSFGGFAFFSNAADKIVMSSDALVIGLILDSLAVAYYNAGGFVITQCMALINAIAWALAPYATACHANGDMPALRQLWVTGTRAVMIFGSILAGGMLLLGLDFLELWIKPKEQYVVRGDHYASGALVMQILAATVLIRSAMSCGKQMLVGMREVRFLAFTSFGAAALNVVLSAILIYRYGLVGVAIASIVAFAVTQLWFQPRHLAQLLGVPLWNFVAPVVWTPVCVIGFMWGTDLLVRDALPAATWSGFVARGFAVSIPAALAGLLLCTSDAEKDKLRAYLRRFSRGKDPSTDTDS